MNWEIRWTERALRDAEKLDRRVKERILDSLDRLAETGQGNVRHLTDEGGELRLRVGDWRVRFIYRQETRTIDVLRVLHRRDVYRR